MDNQKELIIKLLLDNWSATITRASKLFDELTDEQLKNEVAPGRNTGIYLLGHLTAAHDGLFPLLGIGEKLYPELEQPFIKSPDKSVTKMPEIKTLRSCWKEVNDKLYQSISKFSADEWLQKHTAVSAEDFINEPHRNRLNVLISRINHLAYHLGQLAFLKNK